MLQVTLDVSGDIESSACVLTAFAARFLASDRVTA